MNFDFWALSFEGQLTCSLYWITLLALLNDDFANDNSSLLYYHEMIIILLHIVTAQNVSAFSWRLL